MTQVAVTGTREGPWFGRPATGMLLAWQGVAIDRIADGKLTERRVVVDFLDALRTAGFVEV